MTPHIKEIIRDLALDELHHMDGSEGLDITITGEDVDPGVGIHWPSYEAEGCGTVEIEWNEEDPVTIVSLYGDAGEIDWTVYGELDSAHIKLSIDVIDVRVHYEPGGDYGDYRVVLTVEWVASWASRTTGWTW